MVGAEPAMVWGIGTAGSPISGLCGCYITIISSLPAICSSPPPHHFSPTRELGIFLHHGTSCINECKIILHRVINGGFICLHVDDQSDFKWNHVTFSGVKGYLVNLVDEAFSQYAYCKCLLSNNIYTTGKLSVVFFNLADTVSIVVQI
jgi:hypothetical protein